MGQKNIQVQKGASAVVAHERSRAVEQQQPLRAVNAPVGNVRVEAEARGDDRRDVRGQVAQDGDGFTALGASQVLWQQSFGRNFGLNQPAGPGPTLSFEPLQGRGQDAHVSPFENLKVLSEDGRVSIEGRARREQGKRLDDRAALPFDRDRDVAPADYLQPVVAAAPVFPDGSVERVKLFIVERRPARPPPPTGHDYAPSGHDLLQ